MPSKRAGKNVKGATPKQIARQAKKTFGAVEKAAKKINQTAADKIAKPLVKKLVKQTKGAVSDLEETLFTTEAVEMKKGGAMRSKMGTKGGAMGGKKKMMMPGGMKKGGSAMKPKGMAKGGKMMTKGYAKGGAAKSKGAVKGGMRKPSTKKSGLFGRR